MIPSTRKQPGAGDVTGGKKLKSEGVLDEPKGKVPNAVGGIKDAIKGKKRGPKRLLESLAIDP